MPEDAITRGTAAQAAESSLPCKPVVITAFTRFTLRICVEVLCNFRSNTQPQANADDAVVNGPSH